MSDESAHNGTFSADGGLARALLTLGGLVLGWCGCSWGVLALGRWVSSEGSVLLSMAMAAGFILLAAKGSTAYLRRVEPYLRRRRGWRLALLFGCCSIAGLLFVLVRAGHLAPTPAFVFGSANLLVFANLAGAWLVSALKRPAELVPVCVVMAAADLLSLRAGPTRQVVEQLEEYYRRGLEGPEPVAQFLLIQVAVPGIDRLLPLFGVSDWIMVVFLLAAMARFGLDDNLAGALPGVSALLYLPVPAVGLVAAVVLAQGLGVFLPALPVVGALFLAFLLIRFPGSRSLERLDWGVLLFVAVLVAAAGAGSLEIF